MKNLCSVLIVFSILFVQNAAFAITRNDISVSLTPQVLKSRLKKNYTGYEYIVTNESSSKINIVNAQILNGVDGNIGYNTVEEGGGKAVGVLWAICGPVGIFTLGIGWLAGLVGTPIAWIVGNNKDKKAKKESIPYNNVLTIGELAPKDSISVMTLVPLGAKPQLKLSVFNEKTKEYQSFVY